jgi:hypothetical protein
MRMKEGNERGSGSQVFPCVVPLENLGDVKQHPVSVDV